MGHIAKIIFIFFTFLVQSTLVPHLEIYGARPSLMLILLMVLVRNAGAVESIVYAFLIGFVQDVYSPEQLGMNAFTMSVLAYLLVFVKEHFTIEHPMFRGVYTFLIAVLHGCIYLLLFTGWEMSRFWGLFFREALLSALYTAVAAVVIITINMVVEQLGVMHIVREILGFRR